MKATKVIPIGRYSFRVTIGNLLRRPRYSGSRFIILVDKNTYSHCLPTLVGKVKALQAVDFLEVPVGEAAKSIEVATRLWEVLQENGADRHTVIVNLGGGCVSDLGGFVAAGYQRGIHYINIPTTLLAMVDAAIGGKTALNLGGTKNPVGFFYPPDAIVIEPAFLQSLSKKEMKSGLFEMLKTLLLCDAEAYHQLMSQMVEVKLGSKKMRRQHFQRPVLTIDADSICRCARFKEAVVQQDPYDDGPRLMLNLGHTFGHAIEAYSHRRRPLLSHGVAVGIGIACAMYLSVRKLGFPSEEEERYSRMLGVMVKVPRYTLADTEALLAYMRQDKKNADGQILCVLLKDVETPVIHVAVTEDEIRDTLLHVCC